MTNFTPKLSAVDIQKVFSNDEVNKILNSETYNKQHGLTYSKTKNKFVKTDYRKVTTYAIREDDWIKNKILESVSQVNVEYWKFSLTGILENPKIMKYKKDDKYDWHMDVGDWGELSYVEHMVNMRKISYSILLNDNFEGGNLNFSHGNFISSNKWDNIKTDTIVGTGFFFPSFLRHQVSPVISGTRFVLVGWVHGQPFS